MQLKVNTPEEGATLIRMRAESSDRTQPYRDINGFRKLILALSQTGALSALHNGVCGGGGSASSSWPCLRLGHSQLCTMVCVWEGGGGGTCFKQVDGCAGEGKRGEGTATSSKKAGLGDNSWPLRHLTCFALVYAGDGHVVWSRQYGQADAPQQLLDWRSFHDLTHAPQVSGEEEGGGRGRWQAKEEGGQADASQVREGGRSMRGEGQEASRGKDKMCVGGSRRSHVLML